MGAKLHGCSFIYDCLKTILRSCIAKNDNIFEYLDMIL